MDPLLILVLILFITVAALAYKIGLSSGALQRDRYWEEQIPGIKKESIERSRASLGGQFSEQLAPYLPNFKYKPTECKFLGKPVDLLVFEGLDEKEVTEIVFVEVKSGGSELNTVQRKIRDAVKAGRVRWDEYRIPKELTMGKEE
ncbi:MAG: Holliday junction resolvase-like protein [Nanoarchaeota archaeon]|nr:Holliday junction resolvase-like protein [Nanoarchaeota archaeon]